MSTRKSMLSMAIGAIVFAALACSGLDTTPKVSNIRMTTDDAGKTPTSSYAPSNEFYVFADLSSIKTGSVIEAKWYAVSVPGVDSNSEINTSDYTFEPGVDFVYFQLSKSGGGDWPTGSYRVDLYLDSTRVGEQGFTVQ